MKGAKTMTNFEHIKAIVEAEEKRELANYFLERFSNGIYKNWTDEVKEHMVQDCLTWFEGEAGKQKYFLITRKTTSEEKLRRFKMERTCQACIHYNNNEIYAQCDSENIESCCTSNPRHPYWTPRKEFNIPPQKHYCSTCKHFVKDNRGMMCAINSRRCDIEMGIDWDPIEERATSHDN